MKIEIDISSVENMASKITNQLIDIRHEISNINLPKSKKPLFKIELNNDDSVNAILASKFLGIKRKELNKLVKDVEIIPYSYDKMLFKAGELVRYKYKISAKQEKPVIESKPIKKVKKAKSSKTKISEIMNESSFEELQRLNQDI